MIIYFFSGEKITDIQNESSFTCAWHPKRHLLAYACDDKLDRDRDSGVVKVYGFPSDPWPVLRRGKHFLTAKDHIKHCQMMEWLRYKGGSKQG